MNWRRETCYALRLEMAKRFPDLPDILLVEDCDSDALLIELAFRKGRIVNRLVRLASGREALAYLSTIEANDAGWPLFILLDIRLPDVSGYEFLRWMRTRDAFTSLPVVVVTGSDHPGEHTAMLSLGATAFYRKSLDFDKLISLVRSTGAYWSLETGSAAEYPP